MLLTVYHMSMHVFFSGIGGTAIGPLALIANQAGYKVSGSDKQDSAYIEYLRAHGIDNIHIGQDYKQIESLHKITPIDWYVYSSAVIIENPNAPEIVFCKENEIHLSKRDELLNKIMEDKRLKLIAIAGTHGKTTTTAMVIWLMKQLGLPISYSVGAKISFGEMGHFDDESEYFVYECDEFDRNFLQFKPYISLIAGVTWDHHEIFPTRSNYKHAFHQFIAQSRLTILWKHDMDYLELQPHSRILTPDTSRQDLSSLTLLGKYNREDAWLAMAAVEEITKTPLEKLIVIMNNFPGLQRRMEQIVDGLYSDYAHTPEKIRGAMSAATELAKLNNQRLIVVYEPLTNRRQHYMMDEYQDCFDGAERLYWLPSYLAREDPSQAILTPLELIAHLPNRNIAEPALRGEVLKKQIKDHLDRGDMVVCMTGGGGDSLDEWIRQEFNN